MTDWVDHIERRARLIHSEIASVRLALTGKAVDVEAACSHFYKILDEIYTEDLPLARAKDNSDLLLHIEGKAVEGAPRISLVSNVFDNVKVQVRDLTKAIAGILPEKRVAAGDIDLGLSGLAKGSLFIGFSVPEPVGSDGTISILGNDDPIYRATKDALKIIDKVSHTLDASSVSDAGREVNEAVPDPKIRDAALVAVRRISPTGRLGVDTIGVTSSATNSRPANLTRDLRRQVGHMLDRPVLSHEILTLEGWVREIDLDAKRFDLRGITDGTLQDIRCVYAAVENVRPKSLLASRVRVTGTVERRPDAAPRLMALREITFVEQPDGGREPLLL